MAFVLWSSPNHTPIKYIGVQLESNWITPGYLIQVLCYKLKQRSLLRHSSLIINFAGWSFSWEMNLISTNNGKWEEEEACIGTLPLALFKGVREGSSNKSSASGWLNSADVPIKLSHKVSAFSTWLGYLEDWIFKTRMCVILSENIERIFCLRGKYIKFTDIWN